MSIIDSAEQQQQQEQDLQLKAQQAAQTKNALDDFVNKNSAEYLEKCKQKSLQDEYTLEVDGKSISYIRHRLRTKEKRELERTTAEINKTNPRTKADQLTLANRLAEIYLVTAQAYLRNKETNQPITKDEFENMYWDEIKFIVDACYIRTLLGVPS